MDRFSGGCLCGKVRILASGRPYRVGLCHCLDCRKHHGALFYAAAVFPEHAVTIKGEPRDYAGRFSAPRCGSSVFARSGDEIEVHLGALDHPDFLASLLQAAQNAAGCGRRSAKCGDGNGRSRSSHGPRRLPRPCSRH